MSETKLYRIRDAHGRLIHSGMSAALFNSWLRGPLGGALTGTFNVETVSDDPLIGGRFTLDAHLESATDGR